MYIDRLFVHWKEAVLQEPGILFQALSYKYEQAKQEAYAWPPFSIASLFCSLVLPTS